MSLSVTFRRAARAVTGSQKSVTIATRGEANLRSSKRLFLVVKSIGGLYA